MDTTQRTTPYVTRLGPSRGWGQLNLGELWHYRDLLYFFVWRDIKVRYKQTILGASWAILQPLMTMVAFSVFFGRFASIPSDDLPYPIFSYAALVPWTFFANGMAQAGNVLVQNSQMLKKIYFPRLTMPVASVLAGLVDFGLAFLVLLGMMVGFGYLPTVNVVWLPLFVLLALCTALGAGLWLAALNVQFRDIRYMIPFLVQLWLFATPIAYPSSLLAEQWRPLYALNPMVGVVEGFRWALLGTDTRPGPMIVVSAVVTMLLLFSGLMYFRRLERRFADIV